MPAEFWYTVLGGLLSGLVGASLFFLQRAKEKTGEQEAIFLRILQLMTMPRIFPNLSDRTALHEGVQLRLEQREEVKILALRISDKKLSDQIYFCDIDKQDEKKKCIDALQARLNKRLHAKIAAKQAAEETSRQGSS